MAYDTVDRILNRSHLFRLFSVIVFWLTLKYYEHPVIPPFSDLSRKTPVESHTPLRSRLSCGASPLISRTNLSCCGALLTIRLKPDYNSSYQLTLMPSNIRYGCRMDSSS